MTIMATLNRLVPDLASTAVRFPVPIVFSVLLWAYLTWSDAPLNEDKWRIVAAAIAGFLASGAAHMFAEGRQLSRTSGLVFATLAGLASAAAGWFDGWFSTNTIHLIMGLIPVLMIAGFLHTRASQAALWLFNLRLGLAAGLATVVGLVFALGLSAIVEALDVLFGVQAHDLLQHIWAMALALIGPVYGLALVPRSLSDEISISDHRNTLLERGVSVLVNSIAVPVVIAYALILHAYAIKIILDGALPRGQVALMVSVFAIGGTAAWLVAWPWREHGTWLLRVFMRWWFFLLIVPAILLAIAITRRLSDYGVTPERYAMVLAAIWVGLLALYLAFRRNRSDMRMILGMAGLLVVIGSFGPWGANGLTASSQVQRLSALLERHGVLREGKVTPPGKLLEGEESVSGNSMVMALRDVGALHRLRPWFAGSPKDPFAGEDDERWSWMVANAVGEQLGLSAYLAPAEVVNFSTSAPLAIPVPAGSHLIGPLVPMRSVEGAPPPGPISALIAAKELRIVLEEGEVSVPLADLLAATRSAAVAVGVPQPPLILEAGPGTSLVVDQLYGTIAHGGEVHGGRIWIIRRQPPAGLPATP